MLADQLEYVVGVDPHRDSHALAGVEVVTGAVVFEATVAASSNGYAQALALVEQHAQGRRAFAIQLQWVSHRAKPSRDELHGIARAALSDPARRTSARTSPVATTTTRVLRRRRQVVVVAALSSP
jgi:hypothetical protein